MSTKPQISVHADIHDIECAVERYVVGREPRRVAIATEDGGKSAALWEDHDAGRGPEDIAEFCRRAPQYSVGHWETPERYASDFEKVRPLLETARRNGGTGVDVRFCDPTPFVLGTFWEVSLVLDQTLIRFVAKTPALAACLVLLKASGKVDVVE